MSAEPTIADVLDALRELRVGQQEMRADLAEYRLRTSGQLDDIRRRLSTLTDDFADFHRDYNDHGHSHRHGPDGEVEAA